MKCYSDTYFEKVREQCLRYAKNEDIVQEMLLLLWQSFKNGNGLSKVIREQKLIPHWQLHLLFLNALRNLNLNNNTDSGIHHPNPARVVTEDGEIIDFFYPDCPDPLEEQEDTKKSKLPLGKERERWLERIRRLKELGYSDQEIVEMLKPAKQESLF